MKCSKILTFSLAAALLSGCFGSENKKTDTATKKMSKPTPKPVSAISGLITKELKAGTGAIAESGLPVVVHYTGWLFDEAATENKGKKFDSSLDRNQPFSFRLGSGMVIRGWDEGVKGMKVGEARRLIIPPEMAYGSRGAGNAIPPDATLVFDVELLEVKN